MKLLKLRKDFRGSVFFQIRKYRLKFCTAYYSIFTRFNLRLRGIKIGKKLRSYGFGIFLRYPESMMKIGKECSFISKSYHNLAGINHNCVISTVRRNARLVIGDNCGFSGTVVCTAEKIEIGNNVLFGVNTFVSDYDYHNINPELRRKTCEVTEPVRIEDNVWLGMNVVVLKGVSIGKNSVIGANSIVVKNIPENVIAAGNPCKVIRKL